ncbi:DUF952 domain-containing protein [Micrococcus porci]|uniref:DUF952 domain-containing protein n=1 Tax=Micrococcus porci TaxID=2856555 RepID=UPI003CF7B88C
MILHITLPEDWAQARRMGRYTASTRGATFPEVGFLHASEDTRQAAAVAASFYADRPDAFLVAMDEEALTAAGFAVRREPGDPADPARGARACAWTATPTSPGSATWSPRSRRGESRCARWGRRTCRASARSTPRRPRASPAPTPRPMSPCPRTSRRG